MSFKDTIKFQQSYSVMDEEFVYFFDENNVMIKNYHKYGRNRKL